MPLAAHLTTLETSGLLRRAQTEPELEYLFRHALIQDTAYQSLLKADRRVLHAAIGETLERLYPEQMDELSPVLARHFAEAGDTARALKYCIHAGDAALHVYALAEAVTHYRRALGFVQQPAQAAPLYTNLGRALELSSRFEEAIALYAELEAYAVTHTAPELELIACIERAKIYSTANRLANPAHAQAFLEQARPLAQALGDPAAEARILWNLLLLCILQGSGTAQRLHYGQQALALARQHQLREQLAYILHDLWYGHPIGDWAKTEAALREAIVLWRELGNGPMLAESTLRLSMMQGYLGDYPASIAHALEGIALARAAHNDDSLANAYTMVAVIQWEHGAWGDALHSLTQALTLGGPLGNVTALSGGQALLGFIHASLGDVPHGLALAQTAEDFARTNFDLLTPWPRIYRARLLVQTGALAEAAACLAVLEYARLKDTLNFIPYICAVYVIACAELAFAEGDFARVLTSCDEGLQDLTTIGVRFGLYDLLLLKGRAHLAVGALEAAHSTLLAAQAEATTRLAHGAQPNILLALADWATQCNAPAQATAYRAEAIRLNAVLAQSLPPDLRAAFGKVNGEQ